jgi:hypothetical protein
MTKVRARSDALVSLLPLRCVMRAGPAPNGKSRTFGALRGPQRLSPLRGFVAPSATTDDGHVAAQCATVTC